MGREGEYGMVLFGIIHSSAGCHWQRESNVLSAHAVLYWPVGFAGSMV